MELSSIYEADDLSQLHFPVSVQAIFSPMNGKRGRDTCYLSDF